MEESFLVWGYDKWVMQLIGIIEIILAIALFAKPSRNIALVGLSLLMGGAIYTHVTNYEYGELGPAVWILITCTVILAINLLDLEKHLKK